MTEENETTRPAADAASIPGTPQAAVAEALGEPVIPVTRGGIVDVQMRKRVNKRKAQGLPAEMGEDFPGCLIWIRPWSCREIQIFREKYKIKLRALNPKLREGDELTAEDAIEWNRATAVMSASWLMGTFDLGDGNVVTLDKPFDPEDREGAKAIRLFIAENFLPPRRKDGGDEEIDMDFLQILMNLNKGIGSEKYQVIDELGNDYVYGAVTNLDYSDSGA